MSKIIRSLTTKKDSQCIYITDIVLTMPNDSRINAITYNAIRLDCWRGECFKSMQEQN